LRGFFADTISNCGGGGGVFSKASFAGRLQPWPAAASSLLLLLLLDLFLHLLLLPVIDGGRLIDYILTCQ
jgi:hypothetical protein